MSSERAMRLVLDPGRRAGWFARRETEETHVPRAIKYAQTVSEVTGMYTWPVVCQALNALRDDVDYEWIGRRWSEQGTALLCDAQWLARSIQEIVNDLDAFRVQEWTFPDT